MLKAQGVYSEDCPTDVAPGGKEEMREEGLWAKKKTRVATFPPSPPLSGTVCKSQENRLAVLWTVGVFALNAGPVAVGPVLDWIGPKLTTCLGALLNAASLLLLAYGRQLPGALTAAAALLGLGGITFHLAQFHASNLFPARRGLVSSLLVAGFTGCGIVFYFLEMVWAATGGGGSGPGVDPASSEAAFRAILASYAGVCALWVPLAFWVQPWHALRVGQAVVWAGKGRFAVVARRDYGPRAAAPPPLAGAPSEVALVGMGKEGQGAGAGPAELPPVSPTTPGAAPSPGPLSGEAALAYMGLRPAGGGDSADPGWADLDSPTAAAAAAAPGEPRPPPGAPPPARAPTETYGKLAFEARRFVELREKPFWAQFASPESTGMGAFYTLNVLCLQFYLGTTRLQLAHKGDAGTGWAFTKMASVVPAFGFLGIPAIGWLLDHKGYGATLATINLLNLAASLAQAIPSLRFQAVTLILWTYGRFFLYTSYFTIFGALFGFRHFGRMVAVDNCVNGAVGLVQLPLTSWGLHGLGGDFTAVNLIQAAVLLPLFAFCWCMRRWEREDLVPIRPAEGEALPVNLLGPRAERRARFVESLEKRLAGVVG